MAAKTNFPSERLYEFLLYSSAFSLLEVVVGVSRSETVLLDLFALELLA